MNLADRACVPCHKGTPPLDRYKTASLLAQLDDGWSINGDGHVAKAFKCMNFMTAMSFANKIAELAESEGHHPDLHIAWGKCVVEIWTHAIEGLSESDFVLAAKMDRLWSTRENKNEHPGKSSMEKP